jgi:hypothetical protein
MSLNLRARILRAIRLLSLASMWIGTSGCWGWHRHDERPDYYEDHHDEHHDDHH